MTNYDDYSDLAGTGVQGGREVVAPEDEFFHSVYIGGKTRKNHIGVEEYAGKIHIRGVQYNIDEVNMIITHVKDVFSKEKDVQGKRKMECFSFKKGEYPWYGSTRLPNGSPRPCPQTSTDRAVVEFCAPCKAQIIVAGIFCSSDGIPVLTEEKKPYFIFIRGKGSKYGNVSEYLSDLYKLELSPIFEPADDRSKAFEKRVVNNKRFITRLTKGSAATRFGDKDVFVLTRGNELDKNVVLKILDISKNTMEKFYEKFDWSNKKVLSSGDSRPDAGVLSMEPSTPQKTPSELPTPEKPKAEEKKIAFNFNSINFD
jgi:hypothetical protein